MLIISIRNVTIMNIINHDSNIFYCDLHLLKKTITNAAEVIATMRCRSITKGDSCMNIPEDANAAKNSNIATVAAIALELFRYMYPTIAESNIGQKKYPTTLMYPWMLHVQKFSIIYVKLCIFFFTSLVLVRTYLPR